MVVTSYVVRRARELRLYGDTEKRLQRMADRSAICTHEFGNRRYLDFLFEVRDGRVVDVHRIDQSDMSVIA